jgi:redox-sensitive bicupin YhaK (pirin superfamily)
LQKGFTTEYAFKRKGNGLYAFVIEGAVTINGHQLKKRDALGITDTDAVNIQTDSDAELLLIEVPMELTY